MKSSVDDLRRRGAASEKDIAMVSDKSIDELFKLLLSDKAYERTSAIYVLSRRKIDKTKFTDALISMLVSEKSLYTKIAICETLQRGDRSVAEEMYKFLGKIGNNQHKEVPDEVSKKKSYPLPRDIVARVLGKMSVDVFPVFVDKLNYIKDDELSELIDAIGFMAFYNKELSTKENLNLILQIIKKYKSNRLILWKCIICLSAFNLPESIMTLNSIQKIINDENDILFKECNRSLKIIKLK